MKIESDVLDVLKSSTVDEENNILFIPATQLDRKLYVSVNKCLESIGGVWNRKSKGHIFDHNPSFDLDEMINTGEWTNKQKEYQFFETPIELAKRMIKLAEITPDDVLLEPSAGQGRILDLFPKENAYIAVELMEDNCNKLSEKGYSVHKGDFLEMTFPIGVNVIVMNPPFTKHQDVKHILHAWNQPTNGKRRLVSIMSESPFFREDSVSVEFREWLTNTNATIIDLDAGTFKESGTMVKTRLIVVDKI